MGFRVTAALLAGLAVTGVLLELLSSSARGWFANHQFTTAFIAESLLLLAVYLLVNRVIELRDERRWKVIALPLIADLWELADGLAKSLETFAKADTREGKDRQYRMIETTAGIYRDVLNGLYPVFTTTRELACLLPLAKRVGERARYAAAELNIDMETDGKLYSGFQEAYREFECEKARLLGGWARQPDVAPSG